MKKESPKEEDHPDAAHVDSDGQEMDAETSLSIPPEDEPQSPKPPLVVAPSSSKGEGVQVGMGMQVMLQRSSFDKLSKETQKNMLDVAVTLDERNFKYALERLKDRSENLRFLVKCFFAFAVFVGLAILIMASTLIAAGEFSKAMTLMMACVGVLGALFGGAGLTGLAKKFFDSSD